MKTERRSIVTYYDLSPEWQAEARSNLDDQAEDQLYIEPLDHQTPGKHYLLDFSECIRTGNDGYDGGWQVSNNSSISIKIHADNECTLYYF